MDKKLAFLDCFHSASAYHGAILVTDLRGAPTEVRFSAPLRYNPLQVAVYGKVLGSVLCDCFALPLITALEHKPDVILVFRTPLLDLRPLVEIPLLLINTEPPSGADEDSEIPQPEEQRMSINFHKSYPEDSLPREDVKRIFRSLDPLEVFERIPTFLNAAKKT